MIRQTTDSDIPNAADSDGNDEFYCTKCLSSCTITYPQGQRTITNYEEIEKDD